MTLLNNWRTIVLPTVLYGCELWSNLSTNDHQRLNVFQHVVSKNAQNLPTKTRSDICESVFNVLPIKSEIDIPKLLFLGRLCLMDHQSLSKKIFSTFLFSYLENISNKQRGFIPDVINILSTYSLTEYLQTWLHDCSFPPKQTWKKIVRSAVSKLHQTNRNIRMINDNDFLPFQIHYPKPKPKFHLVYSVQLIRNLSL